MFVIFLKTNPQFQNINLSAECRVFKHFVRVEVIYCSLAVSCFDIDIKLDIWDLTALSDFVILVSEIAKHSFELNTIKEL